MNVRPTVIGGVCAARGGMIIGRFAIGGIVAPVGQTVLLVGIDIAANVFFGAAGERCHRSRANDDQRDRRTRFTLVRFIRNGLFHAHNIPRQATSNSM